MPLRARRLPEELLREMDRADAVIHAGDWVDVATLDLMEGRAQLLIGVFGNHDGTEPRTRLPEVARVELSGLRFGVVHEAGPARGREARCAALYPDFDVMVLDHPHILWDSQAPGGPRLLNPESATYRRRQPHRTLMTCMAPHGTLGEIVPHRLPVR